MVKSNNKNNVHYDCCFSSDDGVGGTMVCMWALDGEVMGSIPGRNNSGNELKLVMVWVFWNEFRCSGTHSTRNSLD